MNSRNQNLPDFGDRYSANRTKDRLRREQQKQNSNKSGQEHRDGPRGGPHGGERGSDRSNNQGQNQGGQSRPWNNDQNRGDGSGGQNNPRYQNNSTSGMSDRAVSGGGSGSESSNSLPPRFKKMILHQQGPHSDSNLDNVADRSSRDLDRNEVSLKPTTSSMIFKPKTPSLLPKSAKPLTNNQNILDPAPSLLPSGPALPPASGKVSFELKITIILEANHS